MRVSTNSDASRQLSAGVERFFMTSWRRGHTAMRRCDAALQERRQHSVATRRRTAMRRCDAALQERRQRSVATRRRTAMRRCDAALYVHQQRAALRRGAATQRRVVLQHLVCALCRRRVLTIHVGSGPHNAPFCPIARPFSHRNQCKNGRPKRRARAGEHATSALKHGPPRRGTGSN